MNEITCNANLLLCYVIRKFEAKIGSVFNKTSQGTINRRCCQESHIRTQIVFPSLAMNAHAAWYSRLNSDSITSCELFLVQKRFSLQNSDNRARFKWVTPSPTSSTTPAHSWPRIRGPEKSLVVRQICTCLRLKSKITTYLSAQMVRICREQSSERQILQEKLRKRCVKWEKKEEFVPHIPTLVILIVTWWGRGFG